ncbi:MAG: hypothetical protein DRG32_02985 [Deltaproteobacteria bacterium]|nr:MAG: hypothetical protein DRG32_02985 [Deltaproteobacteria bacterium]
MVQAGIFFRLFKTLIRRIIASFGFNESYSDRLGVDVCPDPQKIVNPSPFSPPRLAIYNFYSSIRLLTADEVFCPSPPVEGGIDELRSGIGFS